MITAGDRTLDVDVPAVTLGAPITLEGAPPPARLAASYAGGFSLMLISRDTAQRHFVAHVSYSGSTSTLQAGTGVADAVLLPGTYDLVYERGHDDGSEAYWPYVSRQSSPSELPNGYEVLQGCVLVE